MLDQLPYVVQKTLFDKLSFADLITVKRALDIQEENLHTNQQHSRIVCFICQFERFFGEFLVNRHSFTYPNVPEIQCLDSVSGVYRIWNRCIVNKTNTMRRHITENNYDYSSIQNLEDHIWWFIYNDETNEIVASHKNQLIEPFLNVSTAKKLEQAFRESLVIELKWEKTIEYRISDGIKNSNFQKSMIDFQMRVKHFLEV